MVIPYMPMLVPPVKWSGYVVFEHPFFMLLPDCCLFLILYGIIMVLRTWGQLLKVERAC